MSSNGRLSIVEDVPELSTLTAIDVYLNMETSFVQLLRLLPVLLISALAIACDPPPPPPATPTPQDLGFQYEVITKDTESLGASGNPFSIATENCGGLTDAVEVISRSRTFTVAFEAEISETIGGKFEANALVAGAEIEAAVGAKLRLAIGGNETVRVDRPITTPPDHLGDVALQWEEIWQPGYVIVYDDDQEIARVPYRVLTTLHLSQIGVQHTPCMEAVADGVNPAPPTIEPTPAASVEPVATSDPTVMPTSTSTPTGTAEVSDEPTAIPACVSIRPNGWEDHVVQQGDTLSKYAVERGVSIEVLLTVNCMQRDSLLSVGHSLYLPQLPPTPVPTTAPATPTNGTGNTGTQATKTPGPDESPPPTDVPPPPTPELGPTP